MTNDSIFAGRTATAVRFVGLAALGQSVAVVLVSDAERSAVASVATWGTGAWLASVAVFAAAFVASTRRIGNDDYRVRVLQLVVVQTLAMVVTTATTAVSTRPEIWLISAQLRFVLTLPSAMILIVAEGILVIVTRTLTHGTSALGLLSIYTRDILPYSALVVITANLLERESQTRKALARVNAELRAMQTLVAEQERTSERLRIARELHDVLGHHLTALALNLEAVKHLLRSEPQALVDRCHALTKELLNDLRHVVTMLRRNERIDLAKVLSPLVDEVRRPAIHLVLPSHVDDVGNDEAQTLVRCVQEIVTNAIKHSRADNLWIELAKAEGGLRVSARDDGVGTEHVVLGNGLLGMTERLESVGGRLSITSGPARGFSLDAWMPLRVPGS